MYGHTYIRANSIYYHQRFVVSLKNGRELVLASPRLALKKQQECFPHIFSRNICNKLNSDGGVEFYGIYLFYIDWN